MTSIFLMFFAFNLSAAEAPKLKWNVEMMDYDPDLLLVAPVKIRVGYVEANTTGFTTFKGNILYLEGLADSMMNHDPLFSVLVKEGYRIIAFDYMGQGGSTGSMNNTRLQSSIAPSLEIQVLAKKVWEKFVDPKYPKRQQKIVLGWSTGGLAAYSLANEKWADAVILLSPGICPRISVGDGILSGNYISLNSLTRASSLYVDGSELNPHVDPIKPKSPFWVPEFVGDLLTTAACARDWKIDKGIAGLVLQGSDDSFVDAECNMKTLNENAPHFVVKVYPGARHEIDNEVATTRTLVQKEILQFLKEFRSR